MSTVLLEPKKMEDVKALRTSSLESVPVPIKLNCVNNYAEEKEMNHDVLLSTPEGNHPTMESNPMEIKDCEPFLASSADPNFSGMVNANIIEKAPLTLFTSTTDNNDSSKIEEENILVVCLESAALPKPNKIEEAELLYTSSVESILPGMTCINEIQVIKDNLTTENGNQLVIQKMNTSTCVETAVCQDTKEIEEPEPYYTSSVESVLSDMVFIDNIPEEVKAPIKLRTCLARRNHYLVEDVSTPGVQQTNTPMNKLSVGELDQQMLTEHSKNTKRVTFSDALRVRIVPVENNEYIDNVHRDPQVRIPTPLSVEVLFCADTCTSNSKPKESEEAKPLYSSSEESILPDMIFVHKISEEQNVSAFPTEIQGTGSVETSSAESFLPEMVGIDKVREEQELSLSLPTSTGDGNHSAPENETNTKAQQVNVLSGDLYPPTLSGYSQDEKQEQFEYSSRDENQIKENFMDKQEEPTLMLISVEPAYLEDAFIDSSARDELETTEIESALEPSVSIQSCALIKGTAQHELTETSIDKIETSIDEIETSIDEIGTNTELEHDSNYGVCYSDTDNFFTDGSLNEVFVPTSQTYELDQANNENAFARVINILMEADLPWGPQDVLRLVERHKIPPELWLYYN